jgi:Tfp pilus assembly protein PilP
MMGGFAKIRNIILTAVMVWALAGVTACDEAPKKAVPSPKPKVVSKPIAQQGKQTPETASVRPGKTAPAMPSTPEDKGEGPDGKTADPVAVAVTEDQVRRETAEATLAEEKAQKEELILAGASLFQSREKYNFKERVDPFIPLISDKKEEALPEAEKENKPRRILTPLEKMELSQIKLVAVVQSSKGPLAMVEEASGKGYEVRLGTYMGRNGGRVTAIEPDGLVIKEYYKDYQGNRRERTQEIKFHKIEGGE